MKRVNVYSTETPQHAYPLGPTGSVTMPTTTKKFLWPNYGHIHLYTSMDLTPRPTSCQDVITSGSGQARLQPAFTLWALRRLRLQYTGGPVFLSDRPTLMSAGPLSGEGGTVVRSSSE